MRVCRNLFPPREARAQDPQFTHPDDAYKTPCALLQVLSMMMMSAYNLTCALRAPHLHFMHTSLHSAPNKIPSPTSCALTNPDPYTMRTKSPPQFHYCKLRLPPSFYAHYKSAHLQQIPMRIASFHATTSFHATANLHAPQMLMHTTSFSAPIKHSSSA